MSQKPKSESSNSQKAIPFEQKTESDKLALKIARTFNDEKHLPMYRFFIEKYGEKLIRKAFDEVESVPSVKIKKSRTALFIFLLRKYANKKD